jgi:hypothetical protein
MIIDKPISELLERAEASGDGGKAFKEFYWVLMRDVDMGTHVMQWIMSKPKLETWEAVALAFFRHVVELADAGSALIRERIDKPCMLVARSQFETWLGLKYLLAAEHVTRAKAYIYCDRLESLRATEKFIFSAENDESTDEHTAKVYRDGLTKARESRTQLAELLAKESYRPIREEYEKCSGGKPRAIKWYSLFGGPSNLRELSKRTGDEHYYVWLYKTWSAHLHGERTLTALSKEDVGKMAMEGFRNGVNAPEITLCIHSITVAAAQIIVKSIVPPRVGDFGDWYLRQGRTKLQWMSSIRFVQPK